MTEDIAVGKSEAKLQIEQLARSSALPWGPNEYTTLRSIFQANSLRLNDVSRLGRELCLNFLREKQGSYVVTLADEKTLERLRLFFGLAESQLNYAPAELRRLKLLSDIRAGQLPVVDALNLVLQRDEVVHWQESCDLLEERVVSRRYEGGSHGVSIRIAKGVNYRVGANRGHMVSDRGIVPVSTGILSITSRRIIFAGGGKSFIYQLNKVVEMHCDREHFFVTPSTGSPRCLKLKQVRNIDVLHAVTAYCLGHQI